MTMRLRRQAFAAATIFLAAPSVAAPLSPFPDAIAGAMSTRPVILISNETRRQEPDIDMFASMPGKKCPTLTVAGRDFACRAVAYFHSQQGRANFTIALDDPDDTSHIISFSGETARREQDNQYELVIDRMLLNSKDRPKADGLPVPLAEPSTGTCKLIGSFSTGQISSISCTATDRNNKKYELQFESDGAPMRMMRLKQGPLATQARRTRQLEQFECRNKAHVARVLPRDLTAYIIRCLAEDNREPAPDPHQ